MNFYLILIQVALIIHSQKVAEYKYYKNSGQLFYDYSGNGNHAINGVDTSISVEDVIPTDRGIYYETTKKQLTLPSFSLQSPFSIMMWVLIVQNCGSMQYYINFFRRFVQNTSNRLNLAYQYYDCTLSLYNNGYPISTSVTLLDVTPLSSWNWELLYLTVESTIGYFGFSNKSKSTFSISPSYSEAGIVCNMHMGAFQSSVPVINTKYFVWSTLIIQGLVDVNDYFGGAVTGSCFLPNCPSSCNPSILLDGNYYCISTSGSSLMSADGTMCDCSSYGCSSLLSCLDPGDCAFPSIEFEEAALNCACNKECTDCSTQNICTECLDPNAIPDISVGCLCKDGYYNYTELGDQVDNCKPCHPDCETCNQADVCLTCKNSALFPASIGCSCKTGFYYDQLNGICEACKTECKTCANANKCIECLKPNTRASGPDCLCVNGYFLNEFNQCEKCQSDCLRCRNRFECIECLINGAEIVESGCECPIGYYPDYNELSCYNCELNCSTCSNPFSCKTCKAENSEVVGNSSLCKCITGYYAINNTELECQRCDYLCKTCKGPLAKDCIDCVDSAMILINGQCSCPEGYFLSIKKNCEVCLELCLTCTSAGCLTCKRYSRLINNKCECLKGYYTSSNECIRRYFNASIEQTSSTSIKIKFTEQPNKILSADYFEIEFSEFLIFNFTVKLERFNEYKIDFTFGSIRENNLTLYLYIKNPVLSTANSLLFRTRMQLLLSQNSISMYDSYISDEIIEKVKSFSYYVIGASFIRFISGGSFSLWIILNTLQLLAYLPLNNLNYSDKVTKLLISFNTYSVIPNPIFYFELNRNSLLKHKNYNQSGIEYADFFVNICPIFIEILILGFFLVILFLFSKIPIRRFSNICQHWLDIYKYGFFCRIWIQLYYDLLIYAFINLQPVICIQGYLFSRFSFVNLPLCILMIIAAGSTAIYLPIYSYINKELISNSENRLTLAQLFCEFKNNKGFLSSQSYTIYFIRRIMYTLNLFYFNDQPYVQYALLNFGAVMQLLFSLYFRPYKENLDMVFSLTCETSVLISIAFSLFFIDVLNTKFIQICELVILTCVSTVLFSGIILMLVNLVKFIREKFRKKMKIEIFSDNGQRMNDLEVNDFDFYSKSEIHEYVERSFANIISEHSQSFEENKKDEDVTEIKADFVISEISTNIRSK